MRPKVSITLQNPETVAWFCAAVSDAAFRPLSAELSIKARDTLLQVREALPRFLKFVPGDVYFDPTTGAMERCIRLEIGEPLLELLLALRTLEGNGKRVCE
jgi:hypothetical protein